MVEAGRNLYNILAVRIKIQHQHFVKLIHSTNNNNGTAIIIHHTHTRDTNCNRTPVNTIIIYMLIVIHYYGLINGMLVKQ